MVFQDLNTLVAIVDSNSLVDVEDPNYALLARATLTIRSLLSRSSEATWRDMQRVHRQATVSPRPPTVNLEGSDTWDFHLQDFEVDFWLNLAEHPFLAGPETAQ